jgi:hypothetical protein
MQISKQRVSIQQVVTKDHQNLFLESYFQCTGRPPERQTFLRSIAADVFRRSYTAAYFLDGEMVGGFCLVLEPPLVELELLPADVRNSHPFLRGIDQRQMISLPMLWLNKNLRGPRHSVHLWADMLSSIAEFERPYLLYTYQMHEKRNWSLYKRGGRSTNLYEGMLANGGLGGVDFVPIKNLVGPIKFLTMFAERRRIPKTMQPAACVEAPPLQAHMPEELPHRQLAEADG